MIDYCMVCKSYLQMKDTQTIRLWNNNTSYVEIVGHVECTNVIHKQIKQVKNMEKKSAKKVLEEIGFDIEEGGKQDGN